MIAEMPDQDRAQRHAALGEPHRLQVVDLLRHSDQTPTQLRRLTGLPSNLLAHHLDVLEQAGLVVRRRSQGDGRRRYVRLQWEALDGLCQPTTSILPPQGPVLFVCTRNAARSQMAAALWRDRTGRDASSAGQTPADAPDRVAVEIAREHGLDTATWRSHGYDAVDTDPALVVSVCDRAREAGVPWTAPHLHWSVPDPAGGDRAHYQRAFDDIAVRVMRLAGEVAA